MEKGGNSLSHHIKFLTDTTCDLPKETLQALDVTALPMHVFLNGEEHLDGVDITRQELYDHAAKTKQLPKTAAITALEFVSAYKQALDQGYDEVIYLGISSKISSTFQNALMARDEAAAQGLDKDRIHPVDSLQLSTGTAQLLYEGRALADQGCSAQEVVRHLEVVRGRLCTSFVLDTLEYLHMGGRCSSIVYVAGSMLRIHPQISMVDGQMIVGDKFRGNLQHCMEQYQKKMVLNVLDTIEPERIFVTHSATDSTMALAAKQQLEALHYFKNISVTSAGATISSHCGPNTMGYLYIKKKA